MALARTDEAGDRPAPEADPRLLAIATRLVPGAALLAAGLAVTVLAGWVLDLEVLKRIVPGASSMKPVSAVCLALLGLCQWVATSLTPARRWAAVCGCAVVAGVAVAILIEYAAGVDLGIDHVLFGTATAADTLATAYPGRPAPNSAAAFVLLAVAQLLLLVPRHRQAVPAAQILCLVAAGLGLLGLYGYAFQVAGSESFLGLTGMAVHTATAVFLIAAATFFARPEAALARLLTAPGASAMLTRRMIVATVSVPPLLGAACLHAQFGRDMFDTRLAVALLVAANVVIFVVVSFVAGARAARLETARDHSELLLARQTQLQAVVDRLPASIFMQDLGGRYILVNEAFEQMLGARRGAALGRTDPELFDRVTAAMLEGHLTQARTAGQTVRFEQVVSFGHAPMTYLSEVFALHDPAGQAYATCGVLTDISEQKRAEARIAATAAALQAELAHRERIEAELRAREAELTTFAYEVAHDLRGPLTPIGGFARLVADDLAAGVTDTGQLLPNLERICQGADRMERLIANLLAYATAQDRTIHPEPVDLQAMVAAIVAERTDHLRTEDPADRLPPDIRTGPLPAVRADPVLCRQLLDNLIGNALKYTFPDRPACIAISAEAGPDGWVRVDVADRGIGIPADDQEDVFASFHRASTGREYAGTGLGLAICRRVVDRHHGSIRVGDNPGGGSRFTFTLPGLRLTDDDRLSANSTKPEIYP